MNKKRIIIYDDNGALLESVAMLINHSSNMECVLAKQTTLDALDDINLYSPDLIIMDIDMPDENGIKATQRIKEEYPLLIILMQTALETNEAIFDALKAGANGYILKKTRPEKFLQQIEDAFHGEVPMTGSVATQILSYFSSQPVKKDYDLTKRETQLLKALVDGYSYKMIASNLGISFDTVKNHITNIYKKLQVNSATEAVSLAIRNNLV